MLEVLLEKVGLSPKEIAIYLYLLKNGKLTAGQIALKTRFKRTTVYSVLEELLKRKIVGKDLGNKVESYYANPPDTLNNLFREEETILRKKKELAKRAVLELTQLGGNAVFSVPKITFISGEDFKDFLYKSAEKWNSSILKYDGTMWGFSNPTYVQEVKDYIEWYLRTAPEGFKVKLFSADVAIERELNQKYPNRSIKQWPGEKGFNSTLLVNGDYIVMIYAEVDPYYLIEIHDKAMTSNLRELFKTIWQIIP